MFNKIDNACSFLIKNYQHYDLCHKAVNYLSGRFFANQVIGSLFSENSLARKSLQFISDPVCGYVGKMYVSHFLLNKIEENLIIYLDEYMEATIKQKLIPESTETASSLLKILGKGALNLTLKLFRERLKQTLRKHLKNPLENLSEDFCKKVGRLALIQGSKAVLSFALIPTMMEHLSLTNFCKDTPYESTAQSFEEGLKTVVKVEMVFMGIAGSYQLCKAYHAIAYSNEAAIKKELAEYIAKQIKQSLNKLLFNHQFEKLNELINFILTDEALAEVCLKCCDTIYSQIIQTKQN